MSSHPECRPSLENCPGTFVEELEHTGGLLEPCDAEREFPRLGDMRYLCGEKRQLGGIRERVARTREANGRRASSLGREVRTFVVS